MARYHSVGRVRKEEWQCVQMRRAREGEDDCARGWTVLLCCHLFLTQQHREQQLLLLLVEMCDSMRWMVFLLVAILLIVNERLCTMRHPCVTGCLGGV